MQETVAVPDAVMLLGEIVPHVKPVGMVSDRLTVPAKWLSEVIVMVEVAEVPAFIGLGVVALI